jgi:predicted DCC family thiol-disulfide oxidoreductase YuxK
MAAYSEADQGKMTVYYDGECPICSIEIGHYRRCRGSGAVEFVDIADAAIVPPHDLARDVALARFHVRSPDGLLEWGYLRFLPIRSLVSHFVRRVRDRRAG